jgi:hypothetical protein
MDIATLLYPLSKALYPIVLYITRVSLQVHFRWQ